MLIFTLRRLNLFFFTLLILSMFAFSLCYLFPGEPIINLTGQINASPETLLQLKQQYHFDENLFFQYISYLNHIFNGDFGLAMNNQLPINQVIAKLLPATIELSIVALFIAMFVGIPVGFIAAICHRKLLDNVILILSMIGYSIPVFWFGLIAILIFSIHLGWLPSSGSIGMLYEIDAVTGIQFIDILLSDNPYKWQAFKSATLHIILPATVIAVAPATIFMRLARTAMLEVLETNYIKSAQAKGLSFFKIIYRHAVRNALMKMILHVGLQFVHLVTFAMITEVIFSWPGIGRWLITSIYQRDYTAIQSGLLVLSSFIFIVHILTDFVYAALNPIVRGNRFGS
jgi:cationic peptide transport system permease protein